MSASKDVPDLTNPAESWSTASTSYAERVGRMSRHAANHLIHISHDLHPFRVPGSYVLDNGAGTGPLTDAVTELFPGIRVLAADVAPGMLETLDAKQIHNVTTRVADASELNNVAALGTDASFTHAFSTFMVMFTLEPLNVVREMHRVLEPGGLIGLGIWGERLGPNTLWEEACQTLDPTYKLPSPFADPNAWRTEDEIAQAFTQLGFKEIHTEIYKVPFEFENTAAYLKFWYGAKNPVADRFKLSFKGDQEEAKKALEKVLKERYNDAKSIFVETVLAIGRK
ncbi:hypothetical protein OEA41_001906 [Lepraria neglecta]|uniref:Methyltransferase domain-containing protein n=1 Tax=Lepraria neglecta TaxID=209136 RepID=A0AAE0DMB3_9LECA|nr:hypothetical protein OEA41_001906 [Lepraria neglecta]